MCVYYFHFDHNAINNCKQIYMFHTMLFAYFILLLASHAHRHAMNYGSFKRNHNENKSARILNYCCRMNVINCRLLENIHLIFLLR